MKILLRLCYCQGKRITIAFWPVAPWHKQSEQNAEVKADKNLQSSDGLTNGASCVGP